MLYFAIIDIIFFESDVFLWNLKQKKMKINKWNRKIEIKWTESNHESWMLVHYPNEKHYSTLKKVLAISKEKLSAAKEKYISLGRNLYCISQRKSIPDNFIVSSHHITLTHVTTG